MNAIGDLVLHRASGPMPWWYRPVGELFDQFLGAARRIVLAEWFLRRFSLLDSLYMVPSTRLVGRTIRHNMRLWLAERRAATRPVPICTPRLKALGSSHSTAVAAVLADGRESGDNGARAIGRAGAAAAADSP